MPNLSLNRAGLIWQLLAMLLLLTMLSTAHAGNRLVPRITAPPQLTYQAPATFQVGVGYTDTTVTGSYYETLLSATLLRNGQAVYGRSGTYIESNLAPGVYTYTVQLVVSYVNGTKEGNKTYTSEAVQVTVTDPPPVINNAEFVSQSVPASMYSDEAPVVWVQMRNTGNTVWRAGTYSLGSANPTDNLNWGLNRVPLAGDVAPGQIATFTFTIRRSVAIPTWSSFQWQMVQEGVAWFGQPSQNAEFWVKPVPQGTISAAPNPCYVLLGGSTCSLSIRIDDATPGEPAEVWASDLDGSNRRLLYSGCARSCVVPTLSVTRSVRLQLIASRFVMASIDVPVIAPMPTVIGEIEGVNLETGTIRGWACATLRDEPIGVHLYVGGAAGAGTFLTAISANQPSEARITAACYAKGTAYRFSISLTSEQRQQYSGRLIYIHGISPIGQANLLIDKSGAFAIPPLPAKTASVARRYVYDQFQQLCKVIEPETGATVMDYDNAGNVLWTASGLDLSDPSSCNRPEAYASGRLVDRTYDARNRLRELRFPDGRGNQVWTYTPDGLPSHVLTTNNLDDEAPIENHYVYNKRRLQTGESLRHTNGDIWNVGYGYDPNGNPVTQVYPDGTAVILSGNALGQVSTIKSTDGRTFVDGVSYYPNGGIRQFRYGNGIEHVTLQNVRQLPSRSIDTGVIDLETSFDAVGNVASILDRQRGDNYSRWMEYDGLDRLTAVGSCSFGGDCWHRFTYDALDNLTSWTLGGVKDYAGYVYDARNRLTNIQNSQGATVVGLGYDEQGNLANKNGQPYEFDYGNRLRRTPNKEWYRYDGHGRRVTKWRFSEAGVLSLYGSSGQLLYEVNNRADSRKSTRYIYLSGSLLATREQGLDSGATTVRYHHTDALGSPVAVSDEASQVVERTDWEPFGAAIGKPGYDGFGYTGHVMDGATGLTYMQQRYYDQQIGRFLSVDPVGADGSSGGNFNRYKYASNNPFRFTDPDGRQEVDNGNFWVGMVKAFRDAVAPLAHAIVDPQGTNIDPSYDRIGPGSGQVEQGGYKFGSALAVAEGAKGLSQGVGAIATGGGKVALSEAQAASLTRFEKKFSAANRGAEVSQTGKTVTFTNEVPGKVPGSKAVYEKSVDASGTTTSVKKTTVAPNGQVIHVKEKTN